ncbi:MAG: poly-gamma-glutamate biosynthesis protein PgsC [candidate division WOR-3 bacterium]|uniref:Poly-gamma-glutamate biosynthesis protein PgsC n=1 Tax=candidate division WOR-3 bacterium TaxID=2052148 RepID=A0A7C1NEJ8_UNCW3|nr:poly-gamma-glutamate biosynthesis protein PgsC [candidate division WOR-3 bacterium]
MIIETIGLGMLVSFLLTETIGLAAGGIVVPGYIALMLTEPVRIIATVLVAIVTFLVIRVLSKVMLVFGRRMLLLGILIGYLLGYITKIFPPVTLDSLRLDLSVIGYVIPGLIAYWMNRQGVVETLSSMILAAVLTRLVILVISGGGV